MAAVRKMLLGKFQKLRANSAAPQFSDDSDDRDIRAPQKPARVKQYKSCRSIESADEQCASRPLQDSRAGVERKIVCEPGIVLCHDLSTPLPLGLSCNGDLNRFRHSGAYEASGASKFVPGEEKAEFEARCLVGIRAVDRIALDVGSPLLADGAFLGSSWIGRTHQLA